MTEPGNNDSAARQYYNEFSRGYDDGRRQGYHAFLDQLTVDVLRPYVSGMDVLEVGCGTGLMMERVTPLARRLVGVDVSPGMAAKAQQRGFHVVEGSATRLPFADAQFDVSYAVKVMPHVQELSVALSELSRVTRQGGVVIVDFYNLWSQRYLFKRLFGPRKVADGVSEADVFTRWADPRTMQSQLPNDLKPEEVCGLRVLTPVASVHDVPLVGSLLQQAERVASRSPLRWFGGFMVLVLRKRRLEP